MSNPFWKSRLGIELLLATLFSLSIAVFVFLGLQSAGNNFVERLSSDIEFMSREEESYSQKLQDYVTEQSISYNDWDALSAWTKNENFVFLTLYKDDRMIYDSALQKEDWFIYEDEAITPWKKTYPITFANGVAQAELICLSIYQFFNYVTVISGAIAFIVFVIILLLLLHRKTRYITQIENELKILEGGDLTYPITVKGRDELGDLASGIDAMRRAVRERQAQEERAQLANKELITAMSHDLRTPLTSLMGYLDILDLKKYADEAQLHQFIHSSREKAYRMKEMSDKLFEYFLVYGKETDDLELRAVDGTELVGQIVEDWLYELEGKGFDIERDVREINCTLTVDVNLIRRVFDNLFSNILKYADKTQPVHAAYWLTDQNLVITLRNGIDKSHRKTESTRIGLKTCEEILKRHKGSFLCEQNEDHFTARLELPLARMLEIAL